jgi:hypothetical protein
MITFYCTTPAILLSYFGPFYNRSVDSSSTTSITSGTGIVKGRVGWPNISIKECFASFDKKFHKVCLTRLLSIRRIELKNVLNTPANSDFEGVEEAKFQEKQIR